MEREWWQYVTARARASWRWRRAELADGPPVLWTAYGAISRRSVCVHRQGELKRGTVGYVCRGPQPATVSFDDRAAERESHAHATGFSGEDAEGRGGRRRFQVQPRVTLGELPHFAERAPPKIAVPRVSQIGVGDGLKAARRVEARGQLIDQALVLDEAVLARRVDGLFVEALGVQFPLFQTRELGANQCRPVCKRCRTVVCPDRYLLEMRF